MLHASSPDLDPSLAYATRLVPDAVLEHTRLHLVFVLHRSRRMNLKCQKNIPVDAGMFALLFIVSEPTFLATRARLPELR